MPQLVEFVTGTWLEGLAEEIEREAETLTRVMINGVFDALLALAMFEQVRAAPQDDISMEAWERERERERLREEELAAQDPRDFTASDYFEWRMRISEQARRDIVKQKWAAGELPRELKHRLPFLHAGTFVTALAHTRRALHELARLDLGGAETEVAAACDDLDRVIPSLKLVRDSVEHAEDRLRGRNRKGQQMALAPVANQAIHAPGGGILVGGMLNNDNFGWTVDDGTYQEVEVSDATIEASRAAVQRALDALPWKEHGHPRYVPF
jgi:hypothetical protein